MPTTETDKESSFKGDEESINFRPSPNFKHMKKYLKSKFEEANSAMNDDNNHLEKGNNMSEIENSQKKLLQSEKSTDENQTGQKVKVASAAIQPPLPPNPPPPDSPTILNLKKEIEEDDYQCSNPIDSENNPQELMVIYKTDQPENGDKPDLIMCRNFIRGTCKKGASCIFAHKVILSQLPGVYTFCRNFQNSVCTFPKCKFVHATVFEKEYFYRTAYLPPHTLSHLKEVNVLQPPPPPPPEETPLEVPPVFSNPPPPPPAQISVNPVMLSTCAATPVDRNGPELFRSPLTTNNSPKREWSDGDDFSRSPRNLDSSEPLAKKCKNCDSNEFRYQYNKNKVEKMIRVNDELDKKIAAVTKKYQRLYSVFLTVFKLYKSPGGATGLQASLNISGEKEKSIAEQINLLLSSSNRLSSFIGEDNSKSMLHNNVNFTNLLANILRNTGEDALPNVGS